jgi:hypothetical protein
MKERRKGMETDVREDAGLLEKKAVATIRLAIPAQPADNRGVI